MKPSEVIHRFLRDKPTLPISGEFIATAEFTPAKERSEIALLDLDRIPTP